MILSVLWDKNNFLLNIGQISHQEEELGNGIFPVISVKEGVTLSMIAALQCEPVNLEWTQKENTCHPPAIGL